MVQKEASCDPQVYLHVSFIHSLSGPQAHLLNPVGKEQHTVWRGEVESESTLIHVNHDKFHAEDITKDLERDITP